MERWKPIPGCEGYEVSSEGRVRSTKAIICRANGTTYTRAGKVLKSCMNTGTGYLATKFGPYGTKDIHKVVLLAFRGPRPDGLVGMHLDEDKSNNALSNLRYGTYSENNQACWDVGSRLKYRTGESLCSQTV